MSVNMYVIASLGLWWSWWGGYTDDWRSARVLQATRDHGDF